MNIMLPMGSYLPNIGGEETYLQSLSTELYRRGHKVTICTMHKKGLPDYESMDGVDVFRFESLLQKVPSREGKPHPPCTDPLVAKSLKIIFDRTKPDVINAHDWMLFSILSHRKSFNVPLVVTLHNYSHICPNGLFERNRKTCDSPFAMHCIGCDNDLYKLSVMKSLVVYAFLKMNRMHLKKVNKFIATHPFQKRIYLQWFGLNDEDIIVVPNPIDLDKFRRIDVSDEALALYSKKWGLEMGSNKIVHVGRLWWDKIEIITSIINAAPAIVAEFPDTQILIVGGGDCFDYVCKLAERVNRLLNKKAVVVTGSIANSEIVQIMNLADIVIGVGRVVLEAMSCGKPAIVAGSVPGPFGGNYSGTLTPDNIVNISAHNFTGRDSIVRVSSSEVAKDCINLLANKKYRSYLGRFGREYTEREHDIRKIAQRVESVYFDAIISS